MHPDGYVEIRDRSKDIIISGGENIASVEVEQVLDSHPSVVESAVVGMPHERWGEVPGRSAATERSTARHAGSRGARRGAHAFGLAPPGSGGSPVTGVVQARIEQGYLPCGLA